VWISLLGASTWAAWMVGLGYVLGDTTDGPIWLQVGIAVVVGFVVAAALAVVQQAVARRRATSNMSGESEQAELTLVR
jgi:membrane protein DedA with SNARE-associated domain